MKPVVICSPVQLSESRSGRMPTYTSARSRSRVSTRGSVPAPSGSSATSSFVVIMCTYSRHLGELRPNIARDIAQAPDGRCAVSQHRTVASVYLPVDASCR